MGLEVYIGPNGFGKTTKLGKIRDDLISSGISEDDIIFLDSEILLMDEMKDTKDDSKTMEYIISEILNTSSVVSARLQYETAIDAEINSKKNYVNQIVDDILLMNNQDRNLITRTTTVSKDFIETTAKKEYKKIVKINSKELIDGKMGSGQKMHLLLTLIINSSKQFIILDEPEKYSHPSLLHKTAKLIEQLSQNKDVYIATHSPKLLSMIDLDISNIYIINDNTYMPKNIDFSRICSLYTTHHSILSGLPNCTKSATYFNDASLKENIKKLHYRDFIETLFSKKVYLVEGVNDYLFINKMLRDNSLFFDEYKIFSSYGKHHMMIFAKIFEELGIEVHIYYDEDNNIREHLSTNSILDAFTHRHKFIPRIESVISYTGLKTNQVEFSNFLESIIIPSSFICT